MRIILLGASGMVGQGVLRECLLDSGVETILSIGRSSIGQRPKLREIVLPDLFRLSSVEDQLSGYDACFFCLGVSSLGMSEQDYRHITYDLTLSAAEILARLNPGMTFIYVSGTGTDSTAQGRVMWARVKGATENAILRLPFKAACAFRPGYIHPLHGVVSKTKWINWLLPVVSPLYPLMKAMAPNQVTTSEQMGRAMLYVARHGPPKPVLETRDINAIPA